ncbi:uncharacterized protein LOC129269879 [Lytechinus pictus]|uniref:uncharacterized protein LOC129269879 n=1 Tax=Lytechinus pictus TaxID=7653 RepID=UPI0030B9CA7D
MNSESLTDAEKHIRNGAIPKSKRKIAFKDECTITGNRMDGRSEDDVFRYEVAIGQVSHSINGYPSDYERMDRIGVSSTSNGDSGIFIYETPERLESFPNPIVHHVHGDSTNIGQAFGDLACSNSLRRKENTGEDAGVDRQDYFTGDEGLEGLRSSSMTSEIDYVLSSQKRRLPAKYGSIGETPWGTTERGRSRNIDESKTYQERSQIKDDRQHGLGKRDQSNQGHRGDEFRRTTMGETPAEGTLHEQPGPKSGRMRTESDRMRTDTGSRGRDEGTASSRNQRLSKTVDVTEDISKKWPFLLWIMFKFLGLFWARPVIEERYCHQCYRRRMEEVIDLVHSRSPEQKHAPSGHLSYFHAPEIGINDSIIAKNPNESSDFRHECDSNPLLNGEAQIGDAEVDHGRVRSGGYCVNDHDGDDGVTGEREKSGRCRVCDALWWTGKGQYFKYTDKSIGLKSWNHRGSGILSMFLLVTYLSLILYDAGHYGSIYWGKKEDLIRYISYMSYLIFAASTPAVCLLALIRNAVTNPAQCFSQWPRTLDIRYVVRRLQYLDLERRGLPNKPFLLACTVFPLLIAIYRLMFYVVLLKTSVKFQRYLACATTAIGLSLYGFFSYFIYLMRISFKAHLKLDIHFIRNHVGQLDVCRAKMSTTVQDFLNLRQLANGFMVMVCGVTTWAIATQITWNYLLFSGVYLDPNESRYNWSIQMYINGLMAMENTLFFLLPCFAIGGFSVNIIWIRFRYRLLELRRARHEHFWYRLLQFIKEQDPIKSSMQVTMLFTLIGLFVALQFGEQNIYYYFSNVTAHNIMPIPPKFLHNLPPQPEGGLQHVLLP